METTNKAYETIRENIEYCNKDDGAMDGYTKGQMDMALQAGLITEPQYKELERLLLKELGLTIYCEAEIVDEVKKECWDCYVVENGDYYAMVAPMKPFDYMDELNIESDYYIGDIYVIFDKEDICDYDVYTLDGKPINFGVLNGTFDEDGNPID